MTSTEQSTDLGTDTESTSRSLASALWRGVRAGILGILVLIALLVIGVPLVTGASTFTITGRSMEPTLPIGTLIVTQPVEPDEIAIGDIITFQLESGEATVATHRVVGLDLGAERAFVTQGDANGSVDAGTVRAEQIRGRLWYSIPLLGWVNAVVTGPVRAIVVPVVVVALFGYAGWSLVGAARDRRARVAQHDPSDEGVGTGPTP